MWLHSLLGLLRAGPPATRWGRRPAGPASRPARARLAVEALEDRSVPGALSLLSGAGTQDLVGALVQAAPCQQEGLHVPITGLGAHRFVLHLESVDGQVTSVVPPNQDHPHTTLMTAVGAGWATQLGHYTETFRQEITAPNAQGVGQILDGRFTSTAADGSTISGTYSGTYTLLGNNMVRYNVTPIWTEGTGRLAGITGQGTVVAVLNTATGAFHFDTVALWKLP
jgi:hypothetical protein